MQTNNPELATSDPTLRPAKNIKYIGRDVWDRKKRKVISPASPIESFVLEGRRIDLPSADDQKRHRVFYHADANDIIRHFPHIYKAVRPKN